jgi:hypothetical protein
MPGASLIEVEGVRILHLDFSGCTLEEAPGLLEVCGKLVRSQPLGSALTLSDFTNARFDSEISSSLRVYTRDNKPFVHFAAVVGVSGLKRVIYRAVLLFTGRTNIVLCDSLEQGKLVLVKAARTSAS